MTEKDLISLCISSLALVVAVYGILERGLATRRAFRIRLTQLIDDLQRIDGDQQVYLQDVSKSEPMKTALRDTNAMRRALLAAQAVDVLAEYRSRVTVPEYVILAAALRETSDTVSQGRVLAEAVANLGKESPFQQAAAWRAWAWFNFNRNNFQVGRSAIQHSLDLVTPLDDIGWLERFAVLLSWFDFEFSKSATDMAHPRLVLDKAEAVLRNVISDEWRVQALDRLRLARNSVVVGRPTNPPGGSPLQG